MIGEERWYRWLPNMAEEAAYSDVAAAVQDFVSVDSDSGRAATMWLREESLANHPSTVTWLMVQEARVEGFYALCSAEVRLTERHRKRLSAGDRAHKLHPKQGASLIAWIAKHRDATVPGELILLHAAYTATEVAKLQGNIALAVDPFDEETSVFWQEEYGFRTSSITAGADAGRPQRLWLPLQLE